MLCLRYSFATVLCFSSIGGFTYGELSAAQAPVPQTNSVPTPKNAPRTVGGGGQGYPVYDPETVSRGQTIFQANCAFCHGGNAKGGETGPDLLRSVLVLDDEGGNKIAPVIHNGRLSKGMPKFALSDEQIADIATFLHDRVKAAALRGTYQVANIVTGNSRAGEVYFNGAGGCSGCHSVTGDIAHIGSKLDPVSIQQKIVMPREGQRGTMGGESADEKPVMVTVTLSSGQSVSGKLDHVDDFLVTLTDSNGNYRSFTRNNDSPRVDIQDPLKAHTELLMKYTDSDIHNLTAYLVTLK